MKKMTAIILMACIFLISNAYAENATATLQDLYAQAELAMATGDYAGAGTKFEALGAYSDASQMAMYCKAIAAAETLGLYDAAISAFDVLDDFRDSKQMSQYYQGRKAQAAADAYSIDGITDTELDSAIEKYKEAIDIYSNLALFKDCLTRVVDCKSRLDLCVNERNARLEAVYQEALALEDKGEYTQAIDAFAKIKYYKDSLAHITACERAIPETKYQEALTLKENGEYQKAADIFNGIADYKDSDRLIIECYIAMYPELGLYKNDTLKSFDELKFFFDITLDMSLAEIKRNVSNNGYTVIDKENYRYPYTEIKNAFGLDYLALCFYMNNDNKLWKMTYMSGNAGYGDLVKEEYANACYSNWQSRLESQFGSPKLTGEDNVLLSPQKLGVGLQIAADFSNHKGSKYNQWIIRLKDNNLVSIVNGIFKTNAGWFHQIEFVLIPEINFNKSIIRYATRHME